MRSALAAAVLWAAAVPGKTALGCDARFRAPEKPWHATDHNGAQLPDVCISASEGHVFLIGDWGGVKLTPDVPPMPADHRSIFFPKRARKFVVGVDDSAQLRVAAQMRYRAARINPDYVLNVGDNFYWGGVNTSCGAESLAFIDTNQWGPIFEDLYKGPGLDGKQWLGVLGNHDYGGYKFTNGWDQAIGYTWAGPGISSDRWVTPAQYWRSKVRYSDFSVDYFFVDTNVFDAFEPTELQNHNICGLRHNEPGATCGAEMGPASVEDCSRWFARLWEEQQWWLWDGLGKSKADWQIIVTHFTPQWGKDFWKKLSDDMGVDLIVSGHRHWQEVFAPHAEKNFLGGTAWVITGGGGGITSEKEPHLMGEDDQYGFMDMTLSKDTLKIEAISHGGVLRSTTVVKPRAPRFRSANFVAMTECHDAVPGEECYNAVEWSMTTGIHKHPEWYPALTPQSSFRDFQAHNAQQGDGNCRRPCNAASTVTTTTTTARWSSVDPVESAATPERLSPSDADLLKFYVYRAQDWEEYTPEDVNVANLEGVLWYLQHEVVVDPKMKFHISRILRYEVRAKAPQRLADAGMNFGPRYAYDRRRCGGPGDCDKQYQKYGFFLGCNHLGDWPFPKYDTHYPNGIWYSLPSKGSCPGSPTGADNCTYSFRPAGEIGLWELQGTAGTGFWNLPLDVEQNKRRVAAARDLFRKRYPEEGEPQGLQDTGCDFDFRGFYGDDVGNATSEEDVRKMRETRCSASHGASPGDAVCCGQGGTVSDAKDICPHLMPTCKGYEREKWGACHEAQGSEGVTHAAKALATGIVSVGEESPDVLSCTASNFYCFGRNDGDTGYCQQWLEDSICISSQCHTPAACYSPHEGPSLAMRRLHASPESTLLV